MKKPATKKPCEHLHLVFRDQGRRLYCRDKDCGKTWIMESKPGSMLPELGLIPQLVAIHESPRSLPGQAHPLHDTTSSANTKG